METDSVAVYGEDNNEFKSYYVVWKPLEKEKNINEEKSLNRTM